MKDISNTDDVIDSRDVIKRIEELEDERDSFQEDNELPDYPGFEESDEDSKWAEWDESDEGQELKALQAFADEFEGYCSDWNYGVTLVRESYWVEYAKQYAEDIGAINDDADWPNDCIDWDKAADRLQEDFTSGEFDGVTYWAR